MARSPSTPASRARWITAIATGALWAGAAAVYLGRPLREILIRVVPDDALFYLVIARNAVTGRPSSFDGITLTNGYHPLWWLILEPLALALRGPGKLERGAIAIGLACYAGAAVALDRGLARFGDGARVVALAALALFVLPASWLLTEAPLAILLFALLLGRVLSPTSARPVGTVAALAALTVLARLDAVFLVVPLLAVGAWDELGGRAGIARADVRALARAALPLAAVTAVVAAYMAIGLAVFGHPMPISGALKSSFPRAVVPTLGSMTRYIRGLPPLAGALLWLAARAAGWRPQLPRPVDRGLIAMVLGLILYYAYEILFQKQMAWGIASWGIASWHFALGTVLLAVLLGLAAARLPRPAALAGAALLMGLAAIDVHRKLRADAPVDTSLAALAEAGAWIAAHTGPSAVVAATDPGLVSWLGGRRTIALDGLVNSYDYQVVVRDGRLAEYLERMEVAYVTTLGIYIEPGSEVTKLPVVARLYWPAADTLALWTADTLFTATGGGVRVWRYRPPRPAAP